MSSARPKTRTPSAPPFEDEDERVLVKRGALAVAYEPLEFFHDAVQVPLSPMEGAIMELLMRRGRATWETIDGVLRDGASSEKVRDVLVYRIRRKFAAAGAPDPIESVRGWGLKLRVPPDARRSASLVIGGRLRNF